MKLTVILMLSDLEFFTIKIIMYLGCHWLKYSHKIDSIRIIIAHSYHFDYKVLYH